jgi:superfamily II DNA or RNA helicase
MDRHRSILIQSPTGSGKTATTAEMLRIASLKGKRSWFICHRKEIIKQAVLAFHNIGIKVGIVAAGFPESKKQPIQVCSIQTLARRYQRLPQPDFMIWDEAHHCPSKSYVTLYNQYPKAFHVGLTATPWRLDGSGLEDFFKTMVCGPSVSWLIENGFLSKYKLFAPCNINTDGIHKRMGDFVKSELALAVDKPSITGDAIKHYTKLCHGKRAVVFAVSVEHSKHIVAQFNAQGVPAEHVDGETEQGDRDSALNRFRDGKTLILSNVELFGEGFDLPAIEAVVMLRPTASLGLFLQQCGRGLRVHGGKDTAYILDHAGNCHRHGLPDDDREWSLKGLDQSKKTGEKVVGVKTCPACFACQKPGELKCRFCGHTFEIKYRKVDQKDGDLTEVDVLAERRSRLAEQGTAKGYQELVALGKKRGYKRPELWAKFILRARRQKQEMKK